MKQDFLYGLICIITLITLILVTFIGVTLVINGQKQVPEYQKYIYNEDN